VHAFTGEHRMRVRVDQAGHEHTTVGIDNTLHLIVSYSYILADGTDDAVVVDE
jgi:hypothetical protein